jgi:hypothetical protein
LFSIILRFRKHSVAISADIRKMYRQVLVNPKQRDLQRILWRSSSEIICNDFYVDDMLTGANTIEEVLKIKALVTKLLSEVGFELHKWVIGKDESSSDMNIASTIDIGHNESIKMLGLQWNSKLDQLKYVIHKVHHNERVTKRRVLSSISKIYDPLGLLGPVITHAKLIMQTLWQLNFHWDESIPEDLYTLWLEFQNKLDHLNNIKVPRHITCKNLIT